MAEELSPGESEITQNNDQNSLESLKRVGPQKPVGYLPFSFIEKSGGDPDQIIKEAQGKGLKHLIYSIGTATQDPILYLYDQNPLQSLLDARQAILQQVFWPAEADEFVSYIAENQAPPETDVYDVVADAFADYYNPGRKTFPKPISFKQSLKISLIKATGAMNWAQKRAVFNKRIQTLKVQAQKASAK